jgi:3-phenylpropionate/trans-cinnamate dioxygenase ferredoxin reductase subunit
MHQYQYLIIGGGMTGDAAVRGIRQVDSSGTIGMISAEADLPYNRPPLSKGLWKGKPIDRIWRKTDTLGVDIHLKRTVKSIDLETSTVTDADGEVYQYGKLLLATGAVPRRFPFGGDDIIYFRTLEDYHRLRELTETKQRFAVIGGGFIGSEIAAALSMIGKDVIMIFVEEGIGSRVYPRDVALFFNDYYKGRGIELHPDTMVSGLEKEGDQYRLKLNHNGSSDEKDVLVDGVVAGLGVIPNVELARQAGLTVDDGIMVDTGLHASHPSIFAAGDAARFYNPLLGIRMRSEHEDNANTMGLVAGHLMAGENVYYDHLPYFYSDLFDVGYEAVGLLNPKLETFADWEEPYQKGVIYYLDRGQVRGVLLWNTWKQVDAVRLLMAEKGFIAPEKLKGRIK